jgi:DNA-binding MarR family transcriptional regulator
MRELPFCPGNVSRLWHLKDKQMSEPPFRWASIPEPILYDGRLTHESIRIYACLDRHANKEGVCWPSITRISKLIHISRPTVIKHLKLLEECCFIAIRRENRKKSIYQLPNHKTKLVKELNQIKKPTGKARLPATG